MLIAVEQDKILSFRIDPKFFVDLGQPVQVYFPIQLQNYVVPGNIICVVESSKKLVSLKSQHSGVFRMFNKDLEAFPEKLAADIEVFRLQPLTQEEWDTERKAKEAAAAAKKKPAGGIRANEVNWLADIEAVGNAAPGMFHHVDVNPVPPRGLVVDDVAPGRAMMDAPVRVFGLAPIADPGAARQREALRNLNPVPRPLGPVLR